jgi:4-hydroxy-3-methylbut-2-enyl diphosphate reductase
VAGRGEDDRPDGRASAPPHLVDEVVSALAGLGPVTVTEHRTSEETITFVLPPALRVVP